jgi:amidase
MQTCYSTVSPAERSGVIGFKPTRNLIPSEGLIFASERLDTVGLLTRTVTDAARILQEIIFFSDEGDHYRRSSLRQGLTQAYSATYLSGLRIGIPSNLAELRNVHPAKQYAFRKALYLLEAAGADIVQGVDIAGAAEFETLDVAAKNVLLDTDMKLAIDKYLSTLTTNPQNINNLEDLIAFTKAHPEEEYPRRNVAVLARALATDPEAALYKEMLAKDEWFAGEGGIAGTLNRHKVDALLIPTLSPTLNAFAAKAGSPCMSLPMGKYPDGTEVLFDTGSGLVSVAPGIP